jgi:hypothetical protein
VLYLSGGCYRRGRCPLSSISSLPFALHLPG